LGVRSVVRLCELSQIDVIVTDGAADDQARAWLDRCGVRVIYAERTG
jgi:DeoR/GlpR family transcriptional regulator of sugar metabolism